jgi:hypothetical protein
LSSFHDIHGEKGFRDEKVGQSFFERGVFMVSSISEKFFNFAKKECRGSSDLYEFLSYKIAEDEEMLSFASNARSGQPIPNLLFGAVHYLLLKGVEHELKKFYPSLSSDTRKVEESFPFFKDFCTQNAGEIFKLLKYKIVQTNEVRRCAYLYPAIKYIQQLSNKPLVLVEIGTSAGLQLFLDQYRYSYGTKQFYGKKDSDIHIASEIRGESMPDVDGNVPDVVARIGIDLHINDVTKEEDYLWLKALIWPEHHERRELFEKAAGFVKDNRMRLIEGDGVELLSNLAKEIPDHQQICVFHTHVANQIPREKKNQLLKIIKEIGAHRNIFHLYNNIQDSYLHLDYYLNGKESLITIAETEGHGRWFKWLLPYMD